MDTHGSQTAEVEAVPASGERFEKAELTYFVDEDKTAGQNIGKLLALVFLISFVLLSGVCLWMYANPGPTNDPQAGIGVSADDEHH